MESHSVFSLITRLCEIILDSKDLKDGCSLRVVHLKKLRSYSYGILLKPAENALSDNPHEPFVKAVAAHIQNGIEQEHYNAEGFDKCIERLWSESSQKPYLTSVVYFLSQLHNESFSLDTEQQNVYSRDGGPSTLGFSQTPAPMQYRMYHPSVFSLPKLEDYVVRESTFSSTASIPASLSNQSTLHPAIGLQLNFTNKRDLRNRGFPSQKKPLLHRTQCAGDDHSHQLEDEGYASHGATPLGVSPGGWCGMPWDEIGLLDEACEKKGRLRTWESLGEASPARELPTLMEAGPKALYYQLKIQECLILTMEPSLWSPPKNSTSWQSFFRKIMYLLIGVESECFIFNKKLDSFELLTGTWVEGLSHDALALYSRDFIMMGTCYRRLSSILVPPSSSDIIEGAIQQALRSCMKTYLNLYCGACMMVMQNILELPSLSFLVVKSRIRILQQQIIGLARAFGKWGNGYTMPSGVSVLGHLHRHASGAQKKEQVYLLRYILNSACRAYFNLLERWVYSGEVVDEGDFFVATRMEYISHRSRRYWTRAFSIDPALVPEFLCGLESLLLRCGKSVHFLKLCDPKNAVLEDCLDLRGLKSKQITSLDDKDNVDPAMSLKQSESQTSQPISNPPHQGDPPSKELSDGSTKTTDSAVSPEKRKAELPSDDAVLSSGAMNGPLEDVLENVEKLQVAPLSSEEELRFKAVREIIIDEYEKSIESVEKRRLRAEWRKRRLQLRTQKISPSESNKGEPCSGQIDSQTSHHSVQHDRCLDEPRAHQNMENPSDENLELSIKSGNNTETELSIKSGSNTETDNLSAVFSDVEEKSDVSDLSQNLPTEMTSNDNIVSNPEVIEVDHNSKDTESSRVCGVDSSRNTGKPTDVCSAIVSDDSDILNRDGSQSHSEFLENCESDEPGSGEEKAEKEDSSGREEINGSSGDGVEVPTILGSKNERFADDVLFGDHEYHPTASATVSPRRTPLKRVDGLFSFPSASDVCSAEEESPEDETSQLDWPFRPVLVSLISHSRKVDAALMKWLLVDKGLISHLHSLRSYFFLLDGEFGRRLSEDLFSAMRHKPGKKPSVECLNAVMLNGILSNALASSTHAVSDPNAYLLSMTLRECPAQASAIEQLGSIQMVYDAPWPLNVVLTDEALSKYSRVLDLLLRLKHASWALEDAFMHMRIIDPSKGNKQAFSGGWRSPSDALHHSPQYRKLHIFRHQMLNLIRSVQSYITAEVLQASGKKLEEAIAHSSCLDEFYAEHVSYVKRILFGCLLNKRSETISTILNDILKLIMKFHWSLCSRSWFISQDHSDGESFNLVHPNFSVLARIYGAFQDMTEFLLKYAWRLAHHGYQAHLSSLLLMVNANNFYKPENGCDGNGKDSDSSGPPG